MGTASSKAKKTDITWPVNPDLKPVKAKINTLHPKYGELVKDKTYKIDPKDFGDQIFDPVGWTPEIKQPASDATSGSSGTNKTIRRNK